MNLSIFCKNVAAFVAATNLVSGSLAADPSTSCCKSLTKHVQRAQKAIKRIGQQALHLNKLAPTPITQKDMHEAGGVLLLTDSGDYCLTENICGTILVEANSVCLDLRCHTLNAEGKPHAIIATGYEGLKVFDGRIINSSVSAISINNCNSVELFKLVMSDHALDAMRIVNSFDISVHDVDFINDNAGERAMWFDTCQSITVNNCNASGFLSTIGAIIQLDSCDVASIQDINVTGNTKTAAADVDEFSPGTAFISVDSSSGIDFTHVLVNNNTFDNNVPVADPNSHWRTAEAIFFSSSSSCSLTACETSNNTDIAGSLATEDTEDFPLCLFNCDGFRVEEHQSNSNSCLEAIVYFYPIASLDSNNMVFEGCQANSNFVQELVATFFGTNCQCIVFSAYFGEPVSNIVLRNCQANFNTVVEGGTRQADDPLGALYPMLLAGSNITVDSCQANNNTMQSSGIRQSVVGILVDIAQNVTITNSTMNNNTGGEVSAGMDLFQVRGALVQNCTANSNGGWGIGSDYYFFPDGPIADVSIIDCVCNSNGGNAFSTGIFVNGRNVMVKDCQVYDTLSSVQPSSTSGALAGIIVQDATNVVIEDTNVFNSTSDGFDAHGIIYDTVNDSKILRTQVHGNQNNGIELVGENTNIAILNSKALNNNKGFSVAVGSSLVHGLIQGNKAIGNTSVGFEHATLLPSPFDTAYFNNYAQNNGVNYSISNYIQTVTYSIPTAVYTLVPNGATDFPTLANIDAT